MKNQYYRKNKNIIDEKKLIEYIFEDKKNIYTIDKYLINEVGFLDTIKKAATQPKQFFKDEGKDMAKSVLNFAMFNSICSNLAFNLNKTWAIKNQSYAIIKDIYPKAMQVLSFFYRSKYALIIWRGFKKYYTWDLAMAAILLYEGNRDDKGITYSVSQSKRTTPSDFRSKINEYFNKIKSGQLKVNRITKDIEGDEESSGSGGGSFGGDSGSGGGSGEATSEIFTKVIEIIESRLTSSNFNTFRNRIKADLERLNSANSDMESKKNIQAIIDLAERSDQYLKKYSDFASLQKTKITNLLNNYKSIFTFPISDGSGKKISISGTSTITIDPDFNFGNADEFLHKIKIFFLFIIISKSETEPFVKNIIMSINELKNPS